MLDRLVLENMGLASPGENVLISNRASYYGINRIALGNNSRIDDNCVLAAGTVEYRLEPMFISRWAHRSSEPGRLHCRILAVFLRAYRFIPVATLTPGSL